MRWRRLAAYAGLLLAWAVFAAWQHHEYLRERELAQETLHRQARSVMSALVGGIRAHRRRGHFFAAQLQGSLDGLVKAQDILAVAVTSDDGRSMLSAGSTDLLKGSAAATAGEFWDADGFRIVELLDLPPAPGGLHQGFGEGRGGWGWGQGRGRGGPPSVPDNDGAETPFSAGGKFAVVLVLDRSLADARCRHAAWLRSSVVVAGALVLFWASLAWRVTVRAAARARELETEARHLRHLSQAAAGLAHETRNPLGLIRGWTQRLTQSGLQSHQQQEQARAIVEECDRVTARINQFLAFARPREPELKPVDVEKMADELALLLEPDLDAKNLTFSRTAPAPDKTVRADREMFRQLLFNLVQNAAQASPEGETVEISVRRGQNGGRRIEVADRGPGVSAEKVESLFTPYFTTRPNGTGLGLAIVRHIAGVHGWEAGYTPRPGGGSIFWLDRIRD